MRLSAYWLLLGVAVPGCQARSTPPAAVPLPSAEQAAATRDRRPIAAFAALPAPGHVVPEFSFPRLGGGDPISDASLRGRPALIALWSTYCPHTRAAIAELETLHLEYAPRGASIVVLSGDESADISAFEDSLQTGLPIAIAGDAALRAHFDQSAEAPERAKYRVEWVLPLYLVVDVTGRIVARNWGPHPTSLAGALDSLLTVD